MLIWKRIDEPCTKAGVRGGEGRGGRGGFMMTGEMQMVGFGNQIGIIRVTEMAWWTR